MVVWPATGRTFEEHIVHDMALSDAGTYPELVFGKLYYHEKRCNYVAKNSFNAQLTACPADTSEVHLQLMAAMLLVALY